jgi:hypothetical protein
MEDELALQYGQLNLSENIGMESLEGDKMGANIICEQGICNLIVNYLPHDVDDMTLKVSK